MQIMIGFGGGFFLFSDLCVPSTVYRALPTAHLDWPGISGYVGMYSYLFNSENHALSSYQVAKLLVLPPPFFSALDARKLVLRAFIV